MKLGAFQVSEPLPELNEPHALAMLQPWVDVGGVGTLTLLWLEQHFQTRELARLTRPGDFFDFTRYRPTVYVKDGQRQMTIPNANINYAKRAPWNDFLFLHLLEPHSHGEVYVESLLRLLGKFGVKRYCLIGSMYDLVPHTRPLLVSGGGVGKGAEELAKMGIESGNYQGPTSITSFVSYRAQEIGMETMSLIVHLPQYTKLDDDYMGAVRLMKVLTSLYDIPLGKAYLEKAERQLEQINLALERNPQLKSVVEQLESHYDAQTRKKMEEGKPPLSPEIEKFLTEMDRRFREG